MTETPTTRRRPLLTAVAALLAVALGVGAVELAAGPLYEQLTPEAGRRSLARLLDPDAAGRPSIMPHPYMLYVNTPGWGRAGRRQINSLGTRGPEVAPQPADGTLRVLALGGSTTYGYTVDDPAAAWPARLQAHLAERLGRPVEVINAGLNFGTSAELVAHYRVRYRHLGATVVLIHTGGNDAAPLALPNYHPEHLHFRPGWAPSVVSLRPGERAWLQRSNLLRVLYARWFDGAPAPSPILIEQARAWHSVPPAAALENVARTEPLGFRRNVDLLVRDVLADGAVPVLIPFAMAPPAVLEQVRNRNASFAPYYPVVRAGAARHADELRAIGARRRAPVLELPEGHIPLEEFDDHCHLSAAGQDRKAAYLAEALAPHIMAAGDASSGRPAPAQAP